MENYQKILEKELKKLEQEEKVPTLLLHSCCAPCSSYVLEYLSSYFSITVFYYNPNIYPAQEYSRRTAEQQRLIAQMPLHYPVSFLEGTYDREQFYAMAEGLENVPEGGERCRKCFSLRLNEAAEKAAEGGFDYFTTTLSISPLKNAQMLNEIGMEAGKKYGVKYLNSDFKKKDGYRRSVELSKEYGLYRQDYCGCEFSYLERQRQKEQK